MSSSVQPIIGLVAPVSWRGWLAISGVYFLLFAVISGIGLMRSESCRDHEYKHEWSYSANGPRQEEQPPEPAPEATPEVKLLTEIRDLLEDKDNV